MTRILHVLDHSIPLPLHSGYTFRTRAILKAQEAAGLEVRGITGQRHQLEAPTDEECETEDGLIFHRTPGKPTGPVLVSEARDLGAVALEPGLRALEARAKWLRFPQRSRLLLKSGDRTSFTPTRPHCAVQPPTVQRAHSTSRWSM